MTHLTEEQLNLYLDDEPSAVERASVEAHLADCDACRAELASLQTLFAALNALQPETLTTDLTPFVLQEIPSERRRAVRRWRISWLIPVLQGVGIVLLLGFGWSALAMRYDALAQRIPVDAVRATWADTLTWEEALWTTTVARWQTWWAELLADVLDLPATLGQAIRRWPQLPDLGLTTPQIIALGLAAALVWLVGNSILLRTNAIGLNSSRHSHHQ
jgi:hypothetical protein